MTMKRTCALLALLLACMTVFPIEKSGTVVYINGAKYYIHTVQPGETLYGLAKTYEVGEKVIVENNPATASGLKAGERLRIPFVSDVRQPASEKKLRKTFRTHEVVKGETLYAISRRYEIPIQTIVADNPSLDPIRLHPGDRILIRKQEEGSEDEAGSREQWEEYRQSLNSVADKGYAYHMVHPGETFYSLSRRFSLTEEELGQLNDGLRPTDLKAGAIIKVPAPETAVATDPTAVGQPAEELSQTELDAPAPPSEVEFRPFRAGETLRAALLLPLDVAGQAANTNYLEFYQGFLLGLQEAKTRYGCSVDLTLYNTARDSDRVAQIVASPEFEGTQLIVGPVYEQALYPVVRYAERHAVPVVSPLAHIERMESPVLFQMASEPADKYTKAEELVSSKRVTFICSESTDKEFEQEMLSLLGGREYARHTYKYEHPSVIARRGKNYVSPSDLTPLLENDDDNLFVILADTEVEVDRILAALASADRSLTSRSRTAPRFAVLGNARWNRYNNIDRTLFFQDRIVFFPTYHAKRDSETIRAFDRAYIRAFGALPTLYAYRGYDAAMIFVPGMYNDIQYGMEGRTYTPLQTAYRFERKGNGNRVNRNWMRVDYNADFTITIR